MLGQAETMEQNIQHATVFSGDTDFENRAEYSADKIHQYAMKWIDRMAWLSEPSSPMKPMHPP